MPKLLPKKENNYIKMKANEKIIFLFCAFLLLSTGINSAQTTAFTNVTIIDVRDGAAEPAMTVVISGERILEVGQITTTEVPAGAEVIDATGKYLIPGLWDMHIHSEEDDIMRSVILPLYVAFGITGVREMSGSPGILRLQKEVAENELFGPRMVVGSPLVDGPNPTFPEISIPLANAAQAAKMVDSLKAEGYDFIKTYKFLSPETYRALHKRGKEVGMEISGEVPVSVSLWEAADLGHRTVEHLTGVELACSSREDELRLKYRRQAREFAADKTLKTQVPIWIRTEWEPIASVDPERCRVLYNYLAAKGNWVVPTLMIQRLISFSTDPELREHTGQKYLPKEWWDPEATANFFDPDRQLRQTYNHRLNTLRELQKAGVGILAGTDVPAGFTLHEELSLYVQGGLSPLEALRTATLNPAQYLNRTNELGTVTSGNLADLVLLDANPLENIRNTQKIHAVVANGRYFDRQALDKLLAEAEKAANP